MSGALNPMNANEIWLASQYGRNDLATNTAAINTIKSRAINDKASLMSNIFNDLGNSTTNYANSYFYKTRTGELERLQSAVTARTREESESYRQDSDVAKRQFQINEWSSNNKMDTLFISQLLFISLVFLAPLLYLKKQYLIPSGVFYGVSILVALIFIFTVVFRVQYHDKSRNRHFWNRRRFTEYSEPPTTNNCSA